MRRMENQKAYPPHPRHPSNGNLEAAKMFRGGWGMRCCWLLSSFGGRALIPSKETPRGAILGRFGKPRQMCFASLICPAGAPRKMRNRELSLGMIVTTFNLSVGKPTRSHSHQT